MRFYPSGSPQVFCSCWSLVSWLVGLQRPWAMGQNGYGYGSKQSTQNIPKQPIDKKKNRPTPAVPSRGFLFYPWPNLLLWKIQPPLNRLSVQFMGVLRGRKEHSLNGPFDCDGSPDVGIFYDFASLASSVVSIFFAMFEILLAAGLVWTRYKHFPNREWNTNNS